MKPEIKERILSEVKTLLPEDRIRKEYISLYGSGMMGEVVKEVINHLPEGLEIDLDEQGSLIVIKKEEEPATGLDGILKRSEVYLTKEELPSFGKLFETALNESSLKDFIK